MVEAKPLIAVDEVAPLLQGSAEQPVLILKHATGCGVSRYAYEQWQAFLQTPEAQTVHSAWVRVIEDRAVSLAIAQALGVTHQSPQAILVRNGQAVWVASHMDITATALRSAVADGG